ncbi:MAG: SRPBCC family protein [Cyclobacteriaceae bacterium]
MKFEIKKEIAINAPASKVWKVLADDYQHIGNWATMVPQSEAETDDKGELCGRVCTSTMGPLTERISTWNEEEKSLSYELVGMPAMFKEGSNSWRVKALGEDKSMVYMHGKAGLSSLAGFFMGWMIKSKMSKDMDGLIEDLKYYVEFGKPHPRKTKSQEKWKRKNRNAA